MSLIRGNALAVPLADESVDLVVTSPPYFALRSYTDGGEHYDGQIGSEATPAEFVAALLDVTRECVRVLKPSGSLWVNLGDKYSGNATGGPLTSSGSTLKDPNRDVATGRRRVPYVDKSRPKSLMGLPWRYALACIDDLGMILRAEVIWSKPNGLPESVTDRVRRSHEQWFHLTKEPRYFSAVDEIREPHDGREPHSNAQRGPSGMNRGVNTNIGSLGSVDLLRNPLGKLPGSVWTVPTEPLRVPEHLPQHFAAFPSEWPKRIILGWSPPDGTVLDPFTGTGTTIAVANALGRHGIGLDLSADYLRLARWRCQDPTLRAKVLGHDKPKPEVTGQLALMDAS